LPKARIAPAARSALSAIRALGAYFGTFRFPETALVPQQLIVERHLGDTEASVLLALAPI
jgi:hypothetical protein